MKYIENTYGKNLNALIVNPRLVNASLISSSDTVALESHNIFALLTNGIVKKILLIFPELSQIRLNYIQSETNYL